MLLYSPSLRPRKTHGLDCSIRPDIARLQQIQAIVQDISGVTKALAVSPSPTLAGFMPLFDQLIFSFSAEYAALGLDEVVVAALAPVVRRLVARWEPLGPGEGAGAGDKLFQELRPWKKAFTFSDPDREEGDAVEVFGREAARRRIPKEYVYLSTPFQSCSLSRVLH